MGDAREEVGEEYVLELEQVTRAIVHASMDSLADLEDTVSPVHLRALRTLEDLGGTHVSDLARALDVLPSTASRLSDRLTAAGLITRAASTANRRATRLEITPAGRDVLADVVRVRGDALADVVRSMSPGSRTALLDGVRAFAAAHTGSGPTGPAVVSSVTGAEEVDEVATERPSPVWEALVQGVLEVAPDDVPQRAVELLQQQLGVGVSLSLIDRQQRFLHQVAAAPSVAGDTVPVEGSASGRAVLENTVQEDDGGAVHVPVAVRGRRVGVLVLARRPTPDGDLVRLGVVVALLLLEADQLTDAIETARRTHDFSINAELQWQVLPPPGVTTPDIDVHALIEPAPLVSTDLFDHAFTASVLWAASLVAGGRGIAAAQKGDLAVVALRHARRLGVGLDEQAALADQALHDLHHGRGHVAAVLVEVDTALGTAAAVAAGPAIALRRRAGDIEVLHLPEQPPLGLAEGRAYRSHPLDLVPGDVLCIATPGAVAAPDEDGLGLGIGRLTAILAETRPSDVPRRVIEARRQRSERLSGDASVLCVDWHGRRR